MTKAAKGKATQKASVSTNAVAVATSKAKQYKINVNGAVITTTLSSAILGYASAEGVSQTQASILSGIMEQRHSPNWVHDYLNKEPDTYPEIKATLDMISGKLKDIWAAMHSVKDFKALKDKTLRRQISRRADKAMQRLRDAGKPEKASQRRDSVPFIEACTKDVIKNYKKYLNTSHDKLTNVDNQWADYLEAGLKLAGIRPEALQAKQK